MPDPRPEGYPYVRLNYNRGVYCPVLVDWHPHGYEQVSDIRNGAADGQEAKRDAVRWAQQLGVPYKVVVHG